MNQRVQLTAKQTVNLRMNGQIQQSLQMLQLSSCDLTAMLREEVNDNPLLELEAAPDYSIRRTSRISKSVRDPDALYAHRIDRHESLESALIGQIGVLPLQPAVRRAAEFLAGCVNEAGYLTVSVEEASEHLKLTATVVEEALAAVQSLDPPGVCARSLSECLQLQIQRCENPLPWALEIVRDHLEDLAKGRFDIIAKAVGAEEADVRKVYPYLREFHPRPGMAFGPGDNPQVIPDAVVRMEPEGPVILLNDSVIPRLSVNQDFYKLVKGMGDRTAVSYLLEKLKSAQSVMRGLDQRKATLAKVILAVMEEQRQFLNGGVEAIVPLTMKELADKLDLHESTVSRAVHNKYIATPHGTFDLKFFFSSGLQRQDGEVDSSIKIKARIKEIIQSESKSRPYSDQRIVEILAAESVRLSRRTVAKYREELKILPTFLRKSRS